MGLAVRKIGNFWISTCPSIAGSQIAPGKRKNMPTAQKPEKMLGQPSTKERSAGKAYINRGHSNTQHLAALLDSNDQTP